MDVGGETQASLGRKVRVSQSAVFAWLNGTIPRGSETARLAQHFEVSMDWLINGRATGESASSPVPVGRISALAGSIRESINEIEELVSKGREPETENKGVDTVSEFANTPAMKTPLAQLRARLKRATGAKGMKTKLANFLGVPKPCISDWLSGKREPGGETTLRLLRWVEHQEHQH